MLELGSSGSVRGVSSNGHPYRDPRALRAVPAVEAECRLSAQKGDDRRSASQRAKCAASGRSCDRQSGPSAAAPMSHLMAFLDGRHGSSSILCHTATRAGSRQVVPAGLAVGSWGMAYWRKCGQRGDPLMHLQPSSRQDELIVLARRLACERFAPRADRHDRAASFPFDDYADLRAEGAPRPVRARTLRRARG